MATCRWLGRAADIQEKKTITVANTWAANDTARVTIAGNSVTVVVDTNDTAVIAQEIAAALNATDLTTGLIGAEVRNVPGQTIPEFREVVAEASSSTVLVYAKTFGKPFTMTVSETTAGSGTLSIATTVAATGKNFWNNANNWDGGAVPVDGDTIVFDFGEISAMYGLPQSGLTPASFKHYMSCSARIGLPEMNRDDPRFPYAEYRSRYVVFDNHADDDTTIELGLGDGPGSPMINIHSTSKLIGLEISGTGTPQFQLSSKAVNIKVDASENLDVTISKGSVALAPLSGDSFNYENMYVGFEGSQASDVDLFIGSGAVKDTGGETFIYGGNVWSMHSRGITTMYGGTLWDDGGGGTLTIHGGTAYATNGTGYGNGLTVASTGVVDLRQGVGDVSAATLDLHKGATLLDPHKRLSLSAGIDLNQCKLSDVTLDIGPHRRLTLGTPS